jgi:hypothetical protein
VTLSIVTPIPGSVESFFLALVAPFSAVMMLPTSLAKGYILAAPAVGILATQVLLTAVMPPYSLSTLTLF